MPTAREKEIERDKKVDQVLEKLNLIIKALKIKQPKEKK